MNQQRGELAGKNLHGRWTSCRRTNHLEVCIGNGGTIGLMEKWFSESPRHQTLTFHRTLKRRNLIWVRSSASEWTTNTRIGISVLLPYPAASCTVNLIVPVTPAPRWLLEWAPTPTDEYFAVLFKKQSTSPGRNAIRKHHIEWRTARFARCRVFFTGKYLTRPEIASFQCSHKVTHRLGWLIS